MRKRGVLGITCSVSLVSLLSCGTVHVYENPAAPVFASNEITHTPPAESDSLVVVSFNIRKAEKIEQAISELQTFESTTPVDVFLLQEMSEQGVQSIAKELSLNYLYIPNVYNRLLKKNIGNAILTKGIICDQKKLFLPNKKWVNGRQRQVTVGEVNIQDKKILVYSVHTETSGMKRKKRIEQWEAIIEDACVQSSRYKHIVVGGDFNTLFPKDAALTVQKFSNAGFQWATAAAGFTAHAFYRQIKPREDYIFSKGLQAVGGGKIDSSKASDHYPIYAIFRNRTAR